MKIIVSIEKMCENESKNVNFSCDVCKRVFLRKSSLVEHKYIHSNRYPFECEVCGKKFRQNSNYSKHQKLHRKQDLKYSCDLCGKGFPVHSYLKSHLLSHNQMKTCLCDKCGHTFKHKSDLSRHLKIHENQRQYKCEVCLFGFNDRSALRRHSKRAHPTKDDFYDQSLEKCEKRLKEKTNPCNDLNDSNYFNSVIDYINICRILPVPLPDHIFSKLIEIQKQIALHLGLDSKCCDKHRFAALRTGLHDLNTIIWEDLSFKYKTIN